MSVGRDLHWSSRGCVMARWDGRRLLRAWWISWSHSTGTTDPDRGRTRRAALPVRSRGRWLSVVPDRLQRPGRALEDPELAGDQAVAAIEPRDAVDVGLGEDELGCYEVLAESCLA